MTSDRASAAGAASATCLSPLVVERTRDCERWDQFVTGSPSACLYHLSRWRQVIEETFGHPTIYLSAAAGDRVVGILPLVQLKSWAFGNMLVSVPYFNYGGVCAENEAARSRLLDEAVRVARDCRADFLELRQEVEPSIDWPTKTTKVSMRLELPADAGDLWTSFPAKLRSQVQRPRKAGMTAVIGREDQLKAFYNVFSTNMRDLGTPVYPRSFFERILEAFPESTWISTVFSGETPVASGFLIAYRDRVEIPWASSLRSANRYSPNMLLYWHCLEFACQGGYRMFDFGRSTLGESTYRFKEQWGAKPHCLFWKYWLRDGGRIPQVNPGNPKYRAAIYAWQHLPVGLTRRLGPSIVKYLP
jgi:serine/alanine adding enzyme